MPRTLICVNGHQSALPDGEPDGRPPRCPECGEPASAGSAPTLPLSETAEATPATRVDRARSEPPRRRWARPVAFGVVLVVLAGGVYGVYLLTRHPEQIPDRPNDSEGARAAVVRFIELSRVGDRAAAAELLTDLAREQIRKGSARLDPDLVKERPGQTHEVRDAVVTGDRADVPVAVREAGREQVLVFKVRRQGADWRVHGFSIEFLPGDPDSRLTIDLENPKNLAKEMFGADLEEWGKDWMKEMDRNFNQGIEASVKSTPGPDDLENEALAATDREGFEAAWKADLDVKDRPAGEVLKELVGEMGFELRTTPAQVRALARPLTLQLRGRSRRELVEEVVRRVGLYPVLEERLGVAGNGVLALRPGPRPHPVVFAGPFAVEVTGVDEYVPHATGLLTLRVTATELPPEVAKLVRLGRDADVLAVKRVADARGCDLSDTTAVPALISGRVVPGGYDRTLELPLKNLLRDVTVVKTVRGKVRVPLPARVDDLRIEPPASGAVLRTGAAEIKMTGFHKGTTTVNGKQYPNARFRLEYKGVHPNRVRVLAYDPRKKLIAVSSSGYSGSDEGGSGDFAVRGEPAVVVVKVISAVESADYDFALDDIPLPGAPGMPEKLVPAAFPGHEAPVTSEFVRITSHQFPAKAQFRLTNHSDKDVRLVGVNLSYLDAGGRELKNWPGVTHGAQPPSDRKRPPVLVGRNATAVVEIDTPFLPPLARSVRTDILKVVFTDAIEWAVTPSKK